MKAITLLIACCLFAYSVGHFVSPLASIKTQSAVHAPDAGISISVSPNVIEENDGWVVVSFSGVPQPADTDWIGVYSPSNVDHTKTAPIKFQFAYVAKTYNNTGSGSLRFNLINMWADYGFRFFRNGTDYPIYVSASNTVTFKHTNPPMQGHLALTDDPTQMRVSWASPDSSNQQYVQYGTAHGTYPRAVRAGTSTYTADMLCGPPATEFGWRKPDFLHSVVLTNLQPSQLYFYRFGGDVTGWSEEFNFTSAPLTAAKTGISFFAYGDMGKGEIDDSDEHWLIEPGALNTSTQVKARIEEVDLILHIGDISYAVGYSSQWNEFMHEIEPIAGRVPYMTCPGNHERDFPNSNSYYNDTDSGGECGVPYEMRFTMPTTARDQPWYSFNYGNVHFVFMSTEQNFLVGSAQYNFLVSDLSSVDRTTTPWVIFSGHRPMYIDSTNFDKPAGDQTVASLLRENLEDVLVKYKVNLAFWGHHHSYQRSCPVYQEKCGNSDLPVHIVIGMAGCGLSQNLQTPQPEWIEYVDDNNYGFSKIVTTDKTLKFQYFRNVDGDKPADELTLTL